MWNVHFLFYSQIILTRRSRPRIWTVGFRWQQALAVNYIRNKTSLNVTQRKAIPSEFHDSLAAYILAGFTRIYFATFVTEIARRSFSTAMKPARSIRPLSPEGKGLFRRSLASSATRFFLQRARATERRELCKIGGCCGLTLAGGVTSCYWHPLLVVSTSRYMPDRAGSTISRHFQRTRARERARERRREIGREGWSREGARGRAREGAQGAFAGSASV